MSSISIILCTANRAHNLSQCLKAMRALKVPEGCQAECIVVDNNSVDGTNRAAEEGLAALPFPGRYLFHKVPGTAGAKNAGIRLARGDLLAFTDDDCLVVDDWLVQIWKAFAADPELGVVGGRVELYNPAHLRETIKTSTVPDVLDSIYKVHGFLHGCNLVSRRSALEQVGLFDDRLGGGTPLKAAEDTDLLYRAFRAKLKVAYRPEVVLYHNHGRTTVADLRDLHRNYKIGRGAFYTKHLLRGRLNVFKILYVQMRPPLRRWLRGPNRRHFIGKYFWHVISCAYLFLGSYRYLRLHGARAARPASLGASKPRSVDEQDPPSVPMAVCRVDRCRPDPVRANQPAPPR